MRKISKPSYELNQWQKAIAQNYGGGDYAYYCEPGKFRNYRELIDALNECGDAEFKLYMVELANNEDCTCQGIAEQRLQSIADNANSMLELIHNMEES